MLWRNRNFSGSGQQTTIYGIAESSDVKEHKIEDIS